jgi:hypothetical protein
MKIALIVYKKLPFLDTFLATNMEFDTYLLLKAFKNPELADH